MPDGSRSFEPSDSRNLRRVAELYREHDRYIGRVLRRCGVPEAELDDAIQETFLVAYRRLDDFEGRASPRTWLYAIAVRVASTIRRSHRREHARREKAGDEMHGQLDIDPEAELSRAEAATLLDQMLDQLDDAKRTVFVLAELEGVKAREISEILGLNVRTVHSRLRLARQSFESAVQRFHAQERGRMQRAELRALARRAEPPRAPRRAALAGVIAKIERGEPPALSGWESLTVGAAGGSSFVLPLVATVVIGSGGLAIVASTTERHDPPREARAESPEPDESPAAVSLPEPTPSPKVKPPKESPATPAATTPPPPPEPPPPAKTAAASTTAFEAELLLLEQARIALRNHDATAALQALDDHARRFPRGQLATERAHTRIKALCAADRAAAADALATRLSGDDPSSAARRVYEAACNPGG